MTLTWRKKALSSFFSSQENMKTERVSRKQTPASCAPEFTQCLIHTRGRRHRTVSVAYKICHTASLSNQRRDIQTVVCHKEGCEIASDDWDA